MNKLEQLRALGATTHTSIYNEEAVTAIQLAGITAAKVNECVKLVNTACDYLMEHLGMTMGDALKNAMENGAYQFKDATGKPVGTLTINADFNVEELMSKIDEMNESLTAFNSTYEGIVSQFGGIRDSVAANTTEIAFLKTASANHDNAVSSLGVAFATCDSRLNDAETNIRNNELKIRDLYTHLGLEYSVG